MNSLSRLIAFAALAATSVLTGCASNQALRQALHERDAEIRDLLDEQSTLEAELARANTERSGLESALQDAASRLRDRPEAIEPNAPLSAFPDLDAEGITYARRDGNIVFSVPSAVTFGSGKASVTASGKKALKALGNRMKSEFASSALFYVEGHTDSDPIRKSSFESNRHLSLERALAVHEFLVSECQIEDDRFVVVGHGQYSPVASNDSTANKARNRRVEVIVKETD